MVSGYGYVLRCRRYGAGFLAAYQSLLQTERLDETQMRQLQEEKLAAIVDHAFQHVPHYRDLSRSLGISARDVTFETLPQALPILEKAQVRAEPERFRSEITSGHLLKINTSGTTGSPLEIACTPSVLRTNYAFFARFLSWHGINRTSRSATFAGRTLAHPDQAAPPFWRRNPAFHNIQFSSYHLSPRNLPAYVRQLEQWAPEFIDTYPSSGAILANYINQTGLSGRITPKVVITSSESLMEHQRVAMETAFSCPVRDQYGSAEMASFIAECELGTMHIAPEYGIVELIADRDDETEFGAEIIATGFINPTMPLLRYRTGDRAIQSRVKCACGRSFASLYRIVGRNDDLIITPEGAQIGRLDPIFKGAAGIIECQVVQEKVDSVKLRAVLAPGVGVEALDPVMAQLRLRLPVSMSISIDLMPSLPRGRNGKLRAVVSLLN